MKLDLREITALYINLEQHVVKNFYMQKNLKACGFKHILRVEGVSSAANPVAGCAAAHHKALREIKLPFILFEDDCMIKNFRPEIEIPDDADAIYLGISAWGRMNGHSGPYVQREKIGHDIYRVYNMLGAHCILYLNPEYLSICQRIAYYAGNIADDYHDCGFAEIQRWFKIYAFDDPHFYQTSQYDGTVNSLTSYPTEECLSYQRDFFLPGKIK